MQPKKILVIQNKRIGDVLISSVIANNLKKVLPKSKITYFVYDYTTAVLENNPYIDEIISVDEKELKRIPNLFNAIRELRKQRFDIIFDPYAKFQSRMICLSSRAPIRAGFKKPHKSLKLPFYTHTVNLLDKHSRICGKAIEDRINLVTSVFPVEDPDYVPKIYLTEEEKNYNVLEGTAPPVIILEVMGSSPQKSMPHDYIVEMIDHISSNYNVNILFNYAPHQKKEVKKIYARCLHADKINPDICEDSIRGFVKLMNQSDLLIANEGDSVQIAKALGKPTFTIYSPFVKKEDWCSFEDGKLHDSVHLLEERPDLFEGSVPENQTLSEDDKNAFYDQLTPELILPRLERYLKHRFENIDKRIV